MQSEMKGKDSERSSEVELMSTSTFSLKTDPESCNSESVYHSHK